MSTDSEQFNDATLRAAIRRACGAETAPPALRERLQTLMAAEGRTRHLENQWLPVRSKAPIMAALRSWRGGALAAAVLLVVLAGAAYRMMQGMGQRAGTIQRAALVALMEDHDRCSSDPGGGVASDVHLVAQTLRQQLHRPVLAPDLAAEGWQFRGGGICQVGGRQTAHLWFARGGQWLSVFSMPTDGEAFEESACSCDQIHGHTMARMVKSGELYCVIGHCPQGRLTTAEIRGILENRFADSLLIGERP